MTEDLKGNVLITGGAGFLARGFYARARAEGWPVRFTCLSRDDAKHAALARAFPEVRIIRGDVCDSIPALRQAFVGHDVIIHAAASKYVDRSELAAFDTVRVNVEGSRNVALAAASAGVPIVVGISTDKACEPANVYGLSKAIMERLFLEADGWGGSRFSVVRYGNVIGSTGSVATLFERQARERGIVSITDPDMTRFWMPIGEAIDLVLASLVTPGLVTVGAMKAATIATVAEAVAPGVPVEYIGWRPGEKRHERLISDGEALRTLKVNGTPCYLLAAPGQKVEGIGIAGAIESSDPPGGAMTAEEFAAAYAVAREV